MFTGIITHTGKITEKSENKLDIQTASDLLKKLEHGTSVAIDGICLTVVGITPDSFHVEVMPETFERTNLHSKKNGDVVNLELPATPETFLSGHIVQGHVDGTAILKKKVQEDNSHLLTFAVERSLTRYMVEKGSITVNGISLTIISITPESFVVGIIPHTWENTNISAMKIGGIVNLESDVLAKYVEKLTGKV